VTAREQIAAMLDEMTPDYADADHLREVESTLEELEREFGAHPLITKAIRKISSRIIALEIGNG